jgi:Fe-S-cluster containining protein
MSNSRPLFKKFQKEINKTILDFSDCSICGVCCKDEEVTLKEHDIIRILKNLELDKKSFLYQYTHYNPETKERMMNIPCPFLKENRCTIYPIRPEICRNYPLFILKKDRLVIFSDIEICAQATHFHEVFLDFLSEHFPEVHHYMMKKFYVTSSENHIDKGKSRNAIYSIKHVMIFIEWLNNHEKKQGYIFK